MGITDFYNAPFSRLLGLGLVTSLGPRAVNFAAQAGQQALAKMRGETVVDPKYLQEGKAAENLVRLVKAPLAELGYSTVSKSVLAWTSILHRLRLPHTFPSQLNSKAEYWSQVVPAISLIGLTTLPTILSIGSCLFSDQTASTCLSNVGTNLADGRFISGCLVAGCALHMISQAALNFSKSLLTDNSPLLQMKRFIMLKKEYTAITTILIQAFQDEHDEKERKIFATIIKKLEIRAPRIKEALVANALITPTMAESLVQPIEVVCQRYNQAL